MKYYNQYIDRQEISRETHEKLLDLTVRRRPGRRWAKYGALAACAALIVGVGMWRLAPASSPAPAPSSAGQFAAGYTPLPGEKDTVDPEDIFVVSSPAEGGKLMFPMIPAIQYPDRSGGAEVYAERIYIPGAFTVDLTKEDIQTIFWGPEGKPETVHPKAEQGDLPWMLFWDGYTVRGSAFYDGQGRLVDLTISGEQGRASFTLALCPGEMPFICCISIHASREDALSEFNGITVAGWSEVHSESLYVCGSEFMTADNIGVRFENRNSSMRSEYGGDEDMALGGTKTFNALFVRQAIVGGLYLDHLITAESVPAWRDAEFSTLAQARQEAEFAPYLPTGEPEDFGSYTGNKEFYGVLHYQEGVKNHMLLRWSRGYDDVEVWVHRDGYYSYDLADPARPETYDLRLYTIPWSESVPREYRDTVDSPAFRAEDMSLAIVEARGIEKDTGGLRFHFEVLHPDGTVVSYRCDGMTARQVWEMVEETL